jgi:heme-degrading monooxygenase HmoA
MAETYTSGIWVVKPGEEDDFIAAWKKFAASGRAAPGCVGALRLVRDVDEPNRFMSFGPWESVEAQQNWKATDVFREGMTRARRHVDDFTPAVYEVVASLE